MRGLELSGIVLLMQLMLIQYILTLAGFRMSDESIVIRWIDRVLDVLHEYGGMFP